MLLASQPFEQSTEKSEKLVKKAAKPRFSAPVAMEDIERTRVSRVLNVLVYWSMG